MTYEIRNTQLLKRIVNVSIATIFMVVIGFGLYHPTPAYAFAGGDGTSGNPYQITTCTELQNMNSSLSSYYVLNNNIDCSDTVNWNAGEGFAPVGSVSPFFTGNFNGNGYTISDLTINRPGTSIVGLFARGASAFTVSNVNLTGVTINANGNVGAIVGYFNAGSGFISNVTAGVTINASGSSAGGIAGNINGLTISDSSTSGTITNSSTATGGVVGFFQGSVSITDSHSSANVTGGGGTGGVVGSVGGTASLEAAKVFERISATGNVTGTSTSVGGAIGSSSNYRIVDSFATGLVTGGSFQFIGGFIGRSTGTEEIIQSYATGDVVSSGNSVGGFAGSLDFASVSRSYATGNVSGDHRVGGFVGTSSATFTDSYARGDVTPTTNPSGSFVSRGSYQITRSYGTGLVTGNSLNYGFGGDNQFAGACTSSFWDTQTTGRATSFCGATGKTTLQMKDIATYTDLSTPGLAEAWDFSGTQNDDAGTNDIWVIDGVNNDGYPYLSFQDLTPPNQAPTVASLGPTSYVDGSYGSDQAPQLTFTLNDPNTDDTVQYQIQIDNNSDFSSPEVDFSSGLQALGSTSFTVGQAAGSGTYTQGSEGQTLADGLYYWRVKAIDNSNVESNYLVANGGEIAFSVDATPPSTPGKPTTSSATTTNTKPTWGWTASTDAGVGLNNPAYTVEWSQNSGFTSGVFVATVNNSSFTHSDALSQGTWYFRVKSTDMLGHVSAYSQAGSIAISLALPSSSDSGNAGNDGNNQATGANNQTAQTNTQDDSDTNKQKIVLNTFPEYVKSSGKLLSLKEKDIVYFNVKNKEHSATVETTGANYAIITLASTPQTATLYVGDTNSYDVNSDGEDDIQISLRGISDGNADLVFRQLPAPTDSYAARTTSSLPNVDNVESRSFNWLPYAVGVVAIVCILLIIRKWKSSNKND